MDANLLATTVHQGSLPPLVALHGFTLGGAMFSELAQHLGRQIIAPDLPGHGSSATHPATMGAAVEGVAAAMDQLAHPRELLGYSMGGRVAIRVCLEHPDLVERLVLVSATTGIDDDGERTRRRDADEALASAIEREGIDRFLDEWLARPMFAGLAERGEAWQAQDRRERAANTASGLAAALRGLGTGANSPVTSRLPELSIPVLVIAGALDHPYLSEAESLASATAGEIAILPGVGHSVVGEAPDALAVVVDRFLGNTDRGSAPP